MDCYNFMQLCKDDFVTSESQSRSQVFFAAIFFKKKALSQWQQHGQMMRADIFVLPI